VERRRLNEGKSLARRVKQESRTPMASLSARYAEVVRLRQEISRVQSGLKLDKKAPSDSAASRPTRSKDVDLSA
jgi:hypothetical protein